MSTNRLPLWIALGIAVLSAIECIHAYPQLPDPMATNFGGDGAPGGWSSKRSFIILYGVSTAFWIGALVLAPFLAARARHDFDDATRRWFRDTVQWFLVASLAFSAVVAHLVLEANLETGRLSGSFALFLAAYMAYVVWWTIRLVRRSRKASTRAK